MHLELAGRARRLGDDINTDYIISSPRKRDTLDESVLRHYLFERLDPGFAASVRPGDLLVAGKNFGCGSAMEIAVTVILASGIRAVLAQSFARTFFRNAINNGLIPVECDTTGIAEGEALTIQVDGASRRVVRASGELLAATALSPIVREILEAGGLVPYVKRRASTPTARPGVC